MKTLWLALALIAGFGLQAQTYSQKGPLQKAPAVATFLNGMKLLKRGCVEEMALVQ